MGPPDPARLKDAARRSRSRPRRPVLDPRRVGRPGLGVSGARGAPTFDLGRSDYEFLVTAKGAD